MIGTSSRMTTTTKMPAAWLKAAALLPLLALTACAGSQRFTGPVGGGTAYGQPSLAPVPAVPSEPVISEPLPPPGGYPVTSAPPGAPGASTLPPPQQQDPFYNPQAGAQPSQQAAPATPADGGVPPLRGSGGQVATLGAGAAPAAPRQTRDSVVGSWTAKEATGGSCRVQLSSAPALDLYRANASGCSNRDLQRITAWDYRDGEVYLYQQGGSVVARLRTGAGGMEGAITKSGAGLSLSR